MADETMGGEQQAKAAAAAKPVGQGQAAKTPEPPNPSSPGNTGTTPGSEAKVG